jgi:hypothetical protein
MADKTPPAKPASVPVIIDDPGVKEAFADDFVGLYGIGPNFHFTFATRRPIKAGTQEMGRLVTARVVLPLDAVLEMYNNLQTAVAQLESRGVIKRRGAAEAAAPAPAPKGKR